MLAPSQPRPRVSPTHDSILLVSWQDYPSIARVATPYLRLAGVRVEPGNHSRPDPTGGSGIPPSARSFDLVPIADGAQKHVELPANSCPPTPSCTATAHPFTSPTTST